MSDKVYDDSVEFLSRCNAILNRYVICDLLDGLIVGVANAVFMAVCGMQYIGLVSVVVGVANLIPTFGPLVGAVIGTFILLMVNPIHAFLFLIFTIILQTIDAVVIKPKLFGNTFGVSGLLILVALVISGKVFGIIGIIFSVPVVAIGDYVYREILIPRLELRKNEPEKDEPPQHDEEDDE